MALSNQKEIEELADKLSECSNSIHIRLMTAIKDKEVDRYQAQSIFQEETILRQRANGLYIDAANCVVQELTESQTNLIKLIDTAKEKITAIKKIADFIDIIADLIVLASAVYAAKPGPIISAFKEVKEDVAALSKTPK